MSEPFAIIGRMTNASNSTLIAELDGKRFIYKPQSGERPLWDFPDGTLHRRERAAFLVSDLLGWNLVPITELRVGPEGIGSFQDLVEAETTAIDIFNPSEVPDSWLVIISGFDETGKEVTLAHEDDTELFRIALFDAVINNADRKAGHVLTTTNGKHWAIDHGVAFNDEPKLRTVLWGWIGTEIRPELLEDLENLTNQIPNSELIELLSESEIDQLNARITNLLESKTMPAPSADWPAVPWPVF